MKRVILILAVGIAVAGIRAQELNTAAVIMTDTSGTVHPWNHLRANNAPENFQFAIVTDRTGGHRPGVFEDAVQKLNLLQPEFVVSVGDLIEGYTRDEKKLREEWDEFTGFIEKLQMPFFYVPGNHDYTNEVMARVWKERFGKSYYHFVYNDVLFLCLNSEEAMKGSNLGGIEKPQYEYIKAVLEDHPDVKWTLVFMHQPLWIFDNTRYWNDVEALLKPRKHTVFVGHNHYYVKYERNNSNYYILATTGGVSRLRGPNFGEFDHLVWVTMTDDGPILANLMLQGVWDDEVVNEEMSNMIRSEPIRIEPLFAEDGFEQGVFRVRITNDANYPMWTVMRFGENKIMHPEIREYQKSIPPNSVEFADLPLHAFRTTDIEEIEPIPLYAWFLYTYEDGREIQVDRKFTLSPVAKNHLRRAVNIDVDGSVEDWPSLPYIGKLKSGEAGGNHQGDFDAHFNFNITYDDENLYLGMEVWDDKVVLNRKKSIWSQDAVLITLDPRKVVESSNNMTNNLYNDDYFRLYFAPSFIKKQGPQIEQAERLPAGTRLVTKKSIEGFTLELAVPLEFIRSYGGENWETVRVNIAYRDTDNKERHSTIWWQPNWSQQKNYIGSGMFFRSSE